MAVKAQSGFTIIELVMVLLIVGIMSAVVISQFNPATFEAAAASGELVSAIRYAQGKSMSNTGSNNYQIAISSGGYRVTQNGVDIPHPVTAAGAYASNWSNVSLSPTGSISFNGFGVPTLGLPMAFSGNQVSITVTVGVESRNVIVEDETGFAR